MTGTTDGEAPEDGATPPDQEWLVLTEGMEPYERFRYITRYVLETAIEDATAYAEDHRIFTDLDPGDREAMREHLRELDQALRADASLTGLEQAFLCATVSAALEARDMDARCYQELLNLARPIDPDRDA